MTLKAAMTKEEWAAKETPGNGDWQDKRDGTVARLEYDPSELYVWVESGFRVALGSHHAVAALCLHEQPFGFTREMLRLASNAGVHDLANQDEIDATEAIFERIEALLPPEAA